MMSPKKTTTPLGPPRVMIVDDESTVRGVLRSRFVRRGFEVAEAESVAHARTVGASFLPTVLITDLRMPGESGDTLLGEFPGVPKIIITGHGDKESAIRAVEKGAFGFFEKPFDMDALEVSVTRAHERQGLEKDKAELLRRLDYLCRTQGREIENLAREKSTRFIGQCESILQIKDTLERLGHKPQASVLILGESGTGKEVVARELHQLTHGPASFAKVPFVALNCSAIPPDLLESELYGHEKGSFSGALSTKIGLTEAARDGTLFLDEIGDMDLRHQAKLLRLIQEKSFRRVGATQEMPFNGRIVAATHRDLLKRSADGQFREDLYYRLSVVNVTLPPLRERGSDVLLLAESLCAKHGLRGLAPERVAELLTHTWPGNIRELNNWIERAAILGDHDESGHLTAPVPNAVVPASRASTAKQLPTGDLKAMREQVLEDFDRQAIQRALVECEFNVSSTAKRLGLDRKNLSRRIKELGLDTGELGGDSLRKKAA